MFYNNLCAKDNFFYDLLKDLPQFFKYDNIYGVCMDYC
ncbi:hypothetical protein J2W55_004434 [Mucilaginibacter pocheonensis]|uniref:Uncharacterized protein n=1 Tax=Mucilaginibacter pocheonensis TaxID=398050 RepID=A0ABU1TGL7_9SPHI|nr:hypothetical protein [Mucilaginibacter pocheonensis]